jgi:hypothetical protein
MAVVAGVGSAAGALSGDWPFTLYILHWNSTLAVLFLWL